MFDQRHHRIQTDKVKRPIQKALFFLVSKSGGGGGGVLVGNGGAHHACQRGPKSFLFFERHLSSTEGRVVLPEMVGGEIEEETDLKIEDIESALYTVIFNQLDSVER